MLVIANAAEPFTDKSGIEQQPHRRDLGVVEGLRFGEIGEGAGIAVGAAGREMRLDDTGARGDGDLDALRPARRTADVRQLGLRIGDFDMQRQG